MPRFQKRTQNFLSLSPIPVENSMTEITNTLTPNSKLLVNIQKYAYNVHLLKCAHNQAKKKFPYHLTFFHFKREKIDLTEKNL